MKRIQIIFYVIVLLPAIGSCSGDSSDVPQKTPFDPKANYQTVGVYGRILPWLLGNMGGMNIMIGGELGFCKRHSVSLAVYHNGMQDHHDNYYGPNNPSNSYTDDHYKSDNAMILGYNFYFNTREMRDNGGCVFYAGLTGRLGKGWEYLDPSFSNDSLRTSKRNYMAIGPQLGAIIKLKERKNFALQFYVGGVYSIKDISDKYSFNLQPSTYTYHFATYDLKWGVNFYWWFRYRQR